MESFVICTPRQVFGLSNQKTIRWVGHLVLNGGVAHKGYWCGNVRERDPPGRSRRTWEDNIEIIFKMCWEYELHWSCTGEGQGADCCECGNELSCSLKCGEFLD
jgi:hypothetical protein